MAKVTYRVMVHHVARWALLYVDIKQKLFHSVASFFQNVTIYRVTHHAVLLVPLTSNQKLPFIIRSTETHLLFSCQQNQGNYMMCYPVFDVNKMWFSS